MNNDIAIKVENVSKKYCKSLKRSMIYGIGDIGRNMLGFKSLSNKLRPKEFWAVDDVSFELKKGETLGIIGPNGSGKTTLLKMLNGIFWPDKGKITINGRVGALIAVGAGFHPMLTGRENIYMNAAILGMSRKEVDRKFDEIVDFADIGDFLDTPVKFYSSGMFVRLGFAVAVHCEPEILLVDEVLAVGDKNFQIKCYKKINDIKKLGVSVILVSHNEYTIREQTKRCLFLNKGEIEYFGDSEETINYYINELNKIRSLKVLKETEFIESNRAKIINMEFMDVNNKKIKELESGNEIKLRVTIQIEEIIIDPVIGINFYDLQGFMFCLNSEYEKVNLNSLSMGKNEVIVIIPNFYLPINKYLCSIIIAEETSSNLIAWENMTYEILVTRPPNSRGSLKLPNRWEISNH